MVIIDVGNTDGATALRWKENKFSFGHIELEAARVEQALAIHGVSYS